MVDFVGGGVMSRAFVRKGSVMHTTRNSCVGTEFMFYDEDGQSITNYYIWMSGKKHQVTNTFIIPYGLKSENLDLIFVKDGYASKITVNVPK